MIGDNAAVIITAVPRKPKIRVSLPGKKWRVESGEWRVEN
jgi:hypothetical protein